MKRKPHGLVAVLAFVAAIVSSPARSATVDYFFAFTNVSNTGGYVTGIIRGITDNSSGPAQSVEVLSNTDGFGLGEYVGTPITNIWTVVGGVITDWNFFAWGISNSSPYVTCCSLFMERDWAPGNPNGAGLSNSAFSIGGSSTDLFFSPGTGPAPSPVPPPAPIPLPAAFPMLLIGLVSLGLIGRLRTAA